jgi:cell division protein ZapA (FtsZ GTPase activity inhibitor)
VDETMAKVRDRTGTVDTLDIAVLTALNIANHLISLRDAADPASQGEAIRSKHLGELISLVEAAIAEPAPTTH